MLSISKEFLEPMRRQGGIARCILNIAMREIGLDRTRIVAIVGKPCSAGVTIEKRPRHPGDGSIIVAPTKKVPKTLAHGNEKPQQSGLGL